MKSSLWKCFSVFACQSAMLAASSSATAQTRPIAMAPPSAGNPAYPAIVRDETPAQHDARLKWFQEARFGLFIHWGVYAVPHGFWNGKPAGAEWIMNHAKIPVAQYKDLAKDFTAAKYDPQAWAALAKDAGVKYVVITAKHHDGFALFDSAYSDWNAVKASGARRDLIRPLADAVRGQGLKFGCYYSQSQDWVNVGGGKGNTSPWDPEQNKGSFDEYLANIALPQVHEIMDKFHPDILWWDTEYHMTPERAKPFFDLVCSYPALLTNSRLGGGVLGDFRTSEQRIPTAGSGRALEVNMTINDSWGYRSDDLNWKSSRQLIRNLSDIAGKGANYLLNVGPTAEGEIPAPEVDRLQAIGKWLGANGEAIYATQAGPLSPPPAWGRTTQKVGATGGATLYIHIWDWPADGKLVLSGIKQPTLSARLLDGGAAVATSATRQGLVLTLSRTAPDPDVSVVAVEFADPIRIDQALTEPATMPSPATAPATTPSPATAPVSIVPAVKPGSMTPIHSKGKTFVMGFVEPVKEWAVYRPAHPVTFSYNYELGATLVTQKEYKNLMGNNPAKHQGDDNLPVEQVSWSEAASYCNARSTREGLPSAYTFTDQNDAATYKCDLKSRGYRLPTNAELEYATRADTTTAYFFGTKDDLDRSLDYSWFQKNSDNQTHAVATRKPNPLGLYDMVGNLFVWANDWEGPYPTDSVTDPTGPDIGKQKVAKGGSFRDDALNHQRTCYHYRWDPKAKHWEVGFRLARTVNE
jgi:alpha-L-fucosidase